MDIKRNILLNPGPATTTEGVKLAQVVPDICPREKEFGDVMEFVSKEITNFVGNNEEYITVLFGGSGTAAVEATISSVVGEGRVLIVNNGAYGERMCEIAEAYKLDYLEFNSSPIEEIDYNDLEKVINESERKVTHIALVHHETTTGLLNDIKRVGKICKKYEVDMIVDGMSSFAGIPIDMEDMNIKYLASSSNKCIQGMAGVSFVIANLESLNKTKDIKPKNLYLNLYKQYEYFKKNYQMRFTPPVQVLYALKEAIIETKKETIENRYERYRSCCEILWRGLEKIGLEKLVDESNHSKLITSIIEPSYPEYDFKKMHDYFYNKGFTIYPGKVSLQDTFRIANIGEIYPKDMENFVDLLEEYINSLK